MVEHALATRGIGLSGVARTLRATGGIGTSPAAQPLHARRRRGRVIRDDVFDKVPDGLEKGPPPPPPDFGRVIERICRDLDNPVQLDVFREFQPKSRNITFKGFENIPALDERGTKETILAIRTIMEDAQREDDDSHALALILSELDD